MLVIKAIRLGKYRNGWGQKLFGWGPARESGRPCAWFHAVSVGEVRVLERVISAFQKEFSGWDVVVTTTTRTGMKVAKQRFQSCEIYYAPFDFSWANRKFLKRMRPKLLVLAELEVWPNMIRLAKRNDIKIAVINARLSPSSFRGYRLLGPLMRPTFRRIDWIGCQTEQYERRFAKLGVRSERLSVTGSLKFDGVETERCNPRTAQLGQQVGLLGHEPILVAGSTQPEDEDVVITAFERLEVDFPDLKLLVVPRHPERFDESAQRLQRTGLAMCRRSDYVKGGSDQPKPSNGNLAPWKILLVDALGELSDWWGTATIAFVGGSFGTRGGQNMIEPSGFGAAVCFGPNTENFRSVVDGLLDQDAARVVTDSASLESFVRGCLDDSNQADEMGRRAQSYVMSLQGATKRTTEQLCGLIGGQSDKTTSSRLVASSRDRVNNSRMVSDEPSKRAA